MKTIKLSATAFITAVIIVFVLRMYVFTFYRVQSDNMNNTLQKNDIIVVQKFGKIKHNNILLINQKGQEFLSRCVALPNDTLLIKHGNIFINGKAFEYNKSPKTRLSKTYIIETDSSADDILKNQSIEFNKYLAHFGIYKINTDALRLQKLIKQIAGSVLKEKAILPEGIYDNSIKNFVNRFYWNSDNTGRIIIPEKGKKINLSPYNYELYKNIIQKETNKKLKRKKSSVFFDNKSVKTYSFLYDYYFVINDKRSSNKDSRYQGFIRKDDIKGKLIFSF